MDDQGLGVVYSRGVLPSRVVLSTAVAVAFLSPAPALAATRIVAPSPDRILQQSGTTLRVSAAKNVTKVTARRDGAALPGRFTRRADGTWALRVTRSALRPGVNHFTVTTRTKRGRTATSRVRVFYGARKRAFTQVRLGSSSRGSVPLRVRTSADPRLRLRLTLNGRDATRVLAPRFGARRAGRLGADDGLRHGRNVLRVVAIKADGTYAAVTRIFRVAAAQPLVGAGPPRRATPGERVTLPGRIVTSPRMGARAAASAKWMVLDAPPGSKALPLTTTSLLSTFTPDKVGTYTLRLVAGTGASAPLDEVTVTSVADVPPIGTPVTTLTNQAAIEIGGSTYAYNPNEDAVQVVMVERATQAVLYENAFSGSAGDVQTITNQMKSYPEPPLVFLANLDFNNESIVDPSWNTLVQAIGGTAIPHITNGDSGGWSVVGVPGAPSGSAFQNNGTAQNSANPTQGEMQGYLQLDSNDQFAFVPAEHLRLDLSAPGALAGQNQMVVGANTYSSGPLSDNGTTCTGGIQVQTLSAENLIPQSSATFATNGCGLAADSANLLSAANYIQGLGAGTSAGTLLMLVQTIGVPRDPSAPAELWTLLSNVLAAKGATIAAIGDGSGSYSFVGGLGISGFPLVEASSALTGQPAHITGVLERARNGNFTPQASSKTGPFTFDLATLAYQAPDPWNPSSGEQKALAYIATTVLDLDTPTQGVSCYVPATPDVRSQYCNSKYYSSWSGYADKLAALPYPAGNGFTSTDWSNVVGELAPAKGYGEFDAVQTVWSTISTAQGTNTQNAVDAVAISQDEAAQIVSALTARANAVGSWLSWAGDLSDAADRLAEVVSEDLGGPLGFIAAGLLVSGDTANLPNGGPALGAFQVKAANFTAQLAESYGTANDQLTQLGDLIVTDKAKLKAFDQGSQYALNDSDAVNQGLQLAAAQLSWRSLLPAAYELVRLPRGTGVNQGVTDARVYQCSTMYGSDPSSYNPFANADPSAQLLTPELFVLVNANSTLPNGSNYETPASPPASFMNPLFAPYQLGANGITQYGMVKPWLLRTAYNLANAPQPNC